MPRSSQGTYQAVLAGLDPALPRRLLDGAHDFPLPLSSDVKQVGLSIGRLAEVLGPGPLPAVPFRAVRARALAFIAGRLCAERALELGGATPVAPVGRGPGGEPLWPAGWTGSITHTAEFAYAAVRRRRGRYDLGIDAEPLLAEDALRAVAALCLSDVETESLTGKTGAREAVTVIFAAKEAYFKAVHSAVRRFVEFKEVVVECIDAGSGRLVIRPTSSGRALRDLPSANGRFALSGHLAFAAVDPNCESELLQEG